MAKSTHLWEVGWWGVRMNSVLIIIIALFYYLLFMIGNEGVALTILLGIKKKRLEREFH